MYKKTNVSVIVVTFKRLDTVLNILENLKHQNFKDFEVIVISDGCKTAYDSRIQEYSNSYHIKCLDTELKNKYGLATARNIGIKESGADYCILIDDDCNISKNFVKQHYMNREKFTIVEKLGRL